MFMNSGVRKRFWAMLSILLLIFSMIISNAYKYLPAENTPKQNHTQVDNYENNAPDIEIPDISTSQTDDSDDVEVWTERKDKVNSIPIPSIERDLEREKAIKNLRKSLQLPDLFQEFEPKNANDDIAKDFAIKKDTVTPKDSTKDTPKVISSTNNDIFAVAKSYKANEEYVKAIEEYKRIAETTNSIPNKAKCYEEIAHIFGIDKRYGTALSYAQKAYNLYPTTYGELLLARLYYKTGNIERANNRINNILKRDFWADR